jgi:polar amino acid transport system substrate-binding protein
MKKLIASGRMCVFLVIVFLIGSFAGTALAKDLQASLAYLPNILETPEKGVFIDLVKAIDEQYDGGKIVINVYPFNRSIDNVIKGKADFHMPMLKNPLIPEKDLPFRYVSVPTGKVIIVLYSRKDNIITAEMIEKAKGLGKFPYKIETDAGVKDFFEFPTIGSSSIEQSLGKLAKGRIDGFLFAQEESDFTLKNMKEKNIHREFFKAYDDVIIIPKGPQGEETNKILSDALNKLKASGKLEELHNKIHVSYQDWQP